MPHWRCVFSLTRKIGRKNREKVSGEVAFLLLLLFWLNFSRDQFGTVGEHAFGDKHRHWSSLKEKRDANTSSSARLCMYPIGRRWTGCRSSFGVSPSTAVSNGERAKVKRLGTQPSLGGGHCCRYASHLLDCYWQSAGSWNRERMLSRRTDIVELANGKNRFIFEINSPCQFNLQLEIE